MSTGQTCASMKLCRAAMLVLDHHPRIRFSVLRDVQPMEDGSLTEGSGRCAFELLGPQLLPGQRYMVDRLEDKVQC
jgi:hypothetical protein